MTAVVADDYGLPWILYTAEDGDVYGHTVPDDGPGDRDFTKPAIQLLDEQDSGRLRVLWNGVS
jgi:hypothetical protein